jgi:transcriptional regulator with XRE-family HTH domain
MNILERIQRLCKKKGINPSKLETELDFGKGAIYKWDKSFPSTDKLQKVAAYFRVPTDFLIYGFEPVRLGDIVRFLKGDRTYEQFAEDTGVDKDYLWSIEAELINEPPAKGILEKIHSGSPDNMLYDLEDLYEVAGYITRKELEDIRRNKNRVTLAASRTDGYEDDLPEEAVQQINDYIEFVKVKYKKKDSDK